MTTAIDIVKIHEFLPINYFIIHDMSFNFYTLAAALISILF